MSDVERLCQLLEEGRMDQLSGIENPGIALGKNELCLMVMNNVQLWEERTVQSYHKGRKGVAFGKFMAIGIPTPRILGIKLETRGSPGKTIAFQQQKMIDTGSLYITTKRVIFVGNKGNKNMKLESILEVISNNDSIFIRRGKEIIENYRGIKGNLTTRVIYGAAKNHRGGSCILNNPEWLDKMGLNN